MSTYTLKHEDLGSDGHVPATRAGRALRRVGRGDFFGVIGERDGWRLTDDTGRTIGVTQDAWTFEEAERWARRHVGRLSWRDVGTNHCEASR